VDAGRIVRPRVAQLLERTEQLRRAQLAPQALEDDAEVWIADRHQVGRLVHVRTAVQLLASLDAAEHAPARVVGERGEPLLDAIPDAIVVRTGLDAPEREAAAD